MTYLKDWLGLMVLYLSRILPIKNNKIVFFSYYGAQYNCNPKYISEYLIEHSQANTFDVVWAFNEPNSKNVNKSIRKVKMMSLKYFYELSTARVIVTNFRTTPLFKKRKHQYYIQTWHSSLRLKQIEQDAIAELPKSYIRMAKKDAAKCDLVISGCQFSTKIFNRAFWYSGEIFEHGTPRNDLFFKKSESLRKKVLGTLNIPVHKKVLLYAPTFRKDDHTKVYDLEYTRLRKTIAEEFGGDWVILVKFHPHLLSKSESLIGNENVIDVTTYDDMQELLFLADTLITDYSSLMFDYVLTGRPCFLFVADLERYIAKERKLYFHLDELPFKHVKTNEQLFTNIKQFDVEKYKENITEFLRQIGTFEEGKASHYLMKQIEEVCFQNGRDEVDEAV